MTLLHKTKDLQDGLVDEENFHLNLFPFHFNKEIKKMKNKKKSK